jgi:tRNA-2-methylthio-N6-dimethylallyladenosine synthase
VSEAVKSERLAGLQQLLDEQQRAFNHACVGMRLPVIMERHGKHPGQIAGRSPYMQSVHVDAASRLIGQTVDVDITHAHPSSLHGTVATATWESASDGLHAQVQEERAAV